jgi:hypothetical protein
VVFWCILLFVALDGTDWAHVLARPGWVILFGGHCYVAWHSNTEKFEVLLSRAVGYVSPNKGGIGEVASQTVLRDASRGDTDTGLSHGGEGKRGAATCCRRGVGR